MGLSRLDNFLKSTRGEILYVDPSSIDSTDSIENKGNSLTRPFKTIQRALIESARFSYQKGLDNDRFGKTTILLYPGEHLIDNRPGWIPDSSLGVNQYRLRNGTSSDDFSPFDVNTNFNIASENNALYKMNSIHGGVIIPRGTSIVGYDLRKTKIRPKYVPNPDEVDGVNIERSAIFRVTGACYLWQFSIFDADPNIPAYIDYSTNTFFPRFSHHKLTCFEYADGVNQVTINDEFIQNYSTPRTDLDIYYEKVGIAYGETSDRGISPDYPSSELDIQPKIDEYLIVGSRGDEVGITSIRAGNGISPSNVITVQLSEPFKNLDVDSPIQIKGIGPIGYNGQQVVSRILSDTEVQYKVQIPPEVPSVPFPSGATLSLILDTVNSASPYIFNCSLRSVYGMCGLNADGDKAGGFKSMVVAQFTGIGLQKDNKAFVKYNKNTGQYEDELASGDQNIYANSFARYKPSYESYHIKCSNNAFIQVVSVFAIGFTRHFLTESGGDLSITNSNSNFGANSLTASGFRNEAFLRDDVGYITHIIPPKEIVPIETSSEFESIDVAKTTSTGSDTLYLYNKNSLDLPPNHILDEYRIGASTDDRLYISFIQNGETLTYSAKITIPGTTQSKEKISYVSRNNSINEIQDDVINFSSQHYFQTGEKIRIISENGYLPDGIDEDQVYYAICNLSGGSPASNITSPTTQIKVAKTLNDAENDDPISINGRGGVLKVVSRVSDKKSGEFGHPIQWDPTAGQWYISVAPDGPDNTIYDAINNLASLGLLGEATPRTYINRIVDKRSLNDTVYRIRYVIPANASITARPPSDGFIIQESNSTIGSNDEEVSKYFRNLTSVEAVLQNVGELRNFRLISNASWTNKVATITSELAHDLKVGSEVEIKNIKSTNNQNGIDDIGFNGIFIVTEVPNRRSFKFVLNTNPGKFTNNTSIRTTDLPTFSRKKYKGIYSIYRYEEIKPYIKGQQDGVYHLIVTNSSNSPSAFPFDNVKLNQPIQNLYPRTNRDDPSSDPETARSFAVSDPIGKVVINDPESSLSKETIHSTLLDFNVGIELDTITSVGTAGTYHDLALKNNHGFNRLISANIISGGSGYGSGAGVTETYYNAQLISSIGFGTEASAKVVVSSAGTIASIEIMDGGTGYSNFDEFSIVGIATTSNHIPATAEPSDIYNNIGDNVKITDIATPSYKKYNGIYKIVSINSSKNIRVSSLNPIAFPSLVPIEVNPAFLTLTGKSLPIISPNGLAYNSTTGIATFATTQSHGLFRNNKVIISGANSSIFNGTFLVEKVPFNNVFEVNVGIATNSPSTTGEIYINYEGLSSRGGLTSKDNENVFERMVFSYGNVTTYLSAQISASLSQTSITLSNKYDLKIGDFILIGSEIMRIKSTVTSNTIQVYRGLMSTLAQNHAINAVVRKIKLFPVELRRNSIVRAAGHTFEYLGYGPGNYSTAFPERQDRQLSPQEELFSQSAKFGAGSVIFTGMNSDGDFYIGNKKINSFGKGETFDTPIPSATGEVTELSSNLGLDYINPDVVSISKSLLVEGGPDGDNISKFNGPVIFNEKITSNSPIGIEANNLLLQGGAKISRKYTVGISTPIAAGNPGDVVFDASPSVGGYIGWVYTNQNNWSKFGGINLSENVSLEYFDQLIVNSPNYGGTNPLQVSNGSSQFAVTTLGNVGIGTNPDTAANPFGGVSLRVNGTIYGDGSGLANVSDIWIKDSVGIHTNTPIGINTSSAKAEFGMYVEGTMAINGSLRVFEIIEKATISNVQLSGTIPIYLADNNVYYFVNPAGATADWALEFRGNNTGLGATSFFLRDFLMVGESMTVAIITTQGATPKYNNQIIIDGSTITPYYYGAERIGSGNPNGIDVYTYVIIRKQLGGSPDSQFTVLYSQAQYKRQ